MRLVIEDAAGTRSVVPLASDEITLGRAREGNTFRLEERNVSRRHARVIRAGGAVYIEDLGSLTGTRVNGERLTARRRLREGDLVEIGGYDLALLPEEDRPGAPPALRPTPSPAAGPDTHATPATPATPALVAAPPAAAFGATPAPPGAATVAPAPDQAATPAPLRAAEHLPIAPTAASAAAAASPAAIIAPATVPHAAAAPGPAAIASAPAPPPSTAVAAPPRASTLARALLAGAMALALGFGAGWAVGTITIREPPPGESTAAAR